MKDSAPVASQVGVLFGAVAISFLATVPAAAQTTATPRQTRAQASVVPRTSDGHPDLQGVWDFGSATPLERPAVFANKPVLTDEEAAAFVKNLPMDGCRLVKCDGSAAGRLESAYGAEWWDLGSTLADNRTSLIIDPPDGKIPPLLPAAQKKLNDERAQDPSRMNADGPEDTTVTDRCIVGFNSGPPMSPSAYNNLTQIFQTRDHVVILNEMIHNARIVPLDGRAHLAEAVRQWVGDARGRWEGDTLVVETTNFKKESLVGPRASMSTGMEHFHMVERFTRVSATKLSYEYTMNDPNVWTKPWTVRIPMAKRSEHLYEYACHEGNYSLYNRLAAARADDKKDAERGKSK